MDWAASSLGPVESWSPALRNALDLALHTRFPVTLFWGPEFVLVPNEASGSRSCTASTGWRRRCAGRAGLTAEVLCDHVIGQLADAVEDDVAMLVLRVAPAV